MIKSTGLFFAAKLLVLLAVFWVASCGTYEDDGVVVCNDTLLSVSATTDGKLKYKLDGVADSLALESAEVRELQRSSQPNGSGWDTTYTTNHVLIWERSGMSDVHLFIQEPYHRDTISSALEAYALLAPHVVSYDQLSLSVAVRNLGGATIAKILEDFGADNQNSQFTIAERSAIYEYQGDSCATIKGLICCSLVNSNFLGTGANDTAVYSFSGNFSARVKLSRD